MANQDQMTTGIFDMALASLERGIETLNVIQTQTQKAIGITFQNADALQGGVRKGFDDWMASIRTVRDSYVKVVEEGLNNLEKQLADTALATTAEITETTKNVKEAPQEQKTETTKKKKK